jgi:uncharacterized protein
MVAAFGQQQHRADHYLALFKRADAERWTLATTWPCVVEASYLLSPPQRFTLLRWVAQHGVTVYPFDQEMLEPMVEMMVKYTQAPRTEMDLADASLLWLATDTGVAQIMTMDERDFSRYRLPDGRSFEIL